MRSGGSRVRVTAAAKDAKVIIKWRGTKKKMVGGVVPAGAAWADVSKKGGGGEGVGPKLGWHVGVEEKCAGAIVESTKNPFSTTILLGGIWTCEAKYGAVGGEKSANGEVIKFRTVISLESTNRTTELSGNVREKRDESGGYIGFLTQRKRPYKVRIIIQKDKVVHETRITRNRRCPYITMN